MTSSSLVAAVADQIDATAAWLNAASARWAAMADIGGGPLGQSSWSGPARDAYESVLAEARRATSTNVDTFAGAAGQLAAMSAPLAAVAADLARIESLPPTDDPTELAARAHVAQRAAEVVRDLDARAAAVVGSLRTAARQLAQGGSATMAAAAAPYIGAGDLARIVAGDPASLGSFAEVDPTAAGLAVSLLDAPQRDAALASLGPSGLSAAAVASLVTSSAAAAGMTSSEVVDQLRFDPGATRTLAWAASQVGTVERGSNLQPYAAMVGHANGQAWCATFTVAAALHGSAAIPDGVDDAYTVTQAQAFADHGSWYRADPADRTAAARPGDLIYYRWAGDSDPTSHVGLVVARTQDGRLVTIEGNVGGSGASDATPGEGVHLMVRRDTSSIVGYGRPRYDDVPDGWKVPTGP